MDSLDSFPSLPQSKEIKINDYIIDYLLESNQECFKICVKDFKNPDINKVELECMSNCYAKYFSSFINVADKINKKIQQ
jgi:hypothetical protein